MPEAAYGGDRMSNTTQQKKMYNDNNNNNKHITIIFTIGTLK